MLLLSVRAPRCKEGSAIIAMLTETSGFDRQDDVTVDVLDAIIVGER